MTPGQCVHSVSQNATEENREHTFACARWSAPLASVVDVTRDDDDSVHNQPVKRFVCRRESPAEMRVTGSAQRDLPRVPGKPRERRIWSPNRKTPGNGRETSDFISEPVRIGEHVTMLPGLFNGRARVGDRRATTRARQQTTRAGIAVACVCAPVRRLCVVSIVLSIPGLLASQARWDGCIKAETILETRHTRRKSNVHGFCAAVRIHAIYLLAGPRQYGFSMWWRRFVKCRCHGAPRQPSAHRCSSD